MSTPSKGLVRRLRLSGGPDHFLAPPEGIGKRSRSSGSLSRVVAVAVKEVSLLAGNGVMVTAHRIRCRPSTGHPHPTAVEALLFPN